MQTVAYFGLAVLVLCVVAIVTVVALYNRLVTGRNRFQNAFSQIDVQLKRRYDLIPNLVETAKGYLAHERETRRGEGQREPVIAARSGAVSASKAAAAKPGDAGAMAGLASAEGLLTGALGKLFALSEAYPDLKANETMNNLMEELTSTENKISFARQAYNDSATAFNILRERFPNNIVAGMFNFDHAALLEFAEEAIEVAPQVSFA